MRRASVKQIEREIGAERMKTLRAKSTKIRECLPVKLRYASSK
jgi:hypothetical protein